MMNRSKLSVKENETVGHFLPKFMNQHDTILNILKWPKERAHEHKNDQKENRMEIIE